MVTFWDKPQKQKTCEETAFGIGIVINGRVYHGKTFTAGEFRSIFTTDEYFGQFALSDQKLRELENDEQIMKNFVTELSKNLALFVNILKLNEIFRGGDIE